MNTSVKHFIIIGASISIFLLLVVIANSYGLIHYLAMGIMGFLFFLFILIYYFHGLVLTILLEWVIYSILIRERFLILLFYSFLINCFTNPLSNLAYLFGMNIFLIEIFAFLFEIPLLKCLAETTWKKALIISLISNLLSFMISFVL